MTPQPSFATNSVGVNSGISVPSSMNTFVSSGFSPSYATGIGASPSNCHAALVHNNMTGCSSPMQSNVITNHNKVREPNNVSKKKQVLFKFSTSHETTGEIFFEKLYSEQIR